MHAGVTLFLILSVLNMLSGCASSSAPTSSVQATTLVRTGEVSDVRDVAMHGGRNSGVGSFLGALLGGFAGSSIGGGTGSAVAGIGGAVAGGMAAQHIEQSGSTTRVTELTVEFSNGEQRTYQVPGDEDFHPGDRVRVTTTAGMNRVERR